MASTRRIELAPFTLDLLDVMEEKIQEALTAEASGSAPSPRPQALFPYCATVYAKTTS